MTGIHTRMPALGPRIGLPRHPVGPGWAQSPIVFGAQPNPDLDAGKKRSIWQRVKFAVTGNETYDRLMEEKLKLEAMLTRLVKKHKFDAVAEDAGYQQEMALLRRTLSVNRQADFKPLPPQPENFGDKRTFVQLPELPPPMAIPLSIVLSPEQLTQMAKQAVSKGLDYTVPGRPVSELKVDRQANARINPADPDIADKLNKDVETDLLCKYPVPWDQQKVARDILQNFSDGHGKTLEGVRLHVTQDKGVYTVRIIGQGEYHYKLLEKIGGTTKDGDADVAGGFGEGAKILSLVLLQKQWADAVSFTSRNWKTEFKLKTIDMGPNLFRHLSTVADTPGNDVTIKTRNADMVKALVEGINYFYHPGNPDMLFPSYENEFGGFKYLGPKGQGNVYLSKQRFQYKDCKDTVSWDKGTDHVAVWTNKKDGLRDRDRSFVHYSELKEKLSPMAKAMSNDDLMKGLRSLEDIWPMRKLENSVRGRYKDKGFNSYDIDKTTGAIVLNVLAQEAFDRRLTTTFPEKYLASDIGMSDELIAQLEQSGYEICPSLFAVIGMKSAKQLWLERGRHVGLQPTPQQIMRINILKQAAMLLIQSGAPTSPIWSQDVEKPIYIFNRKNEAEHKANRDVLGEYGQTHVWLDVSQMDHPSFEEAFGTYLHEMAHKHGGDGSDYFGYKLTDYIPTIITAMINGQNGFGNYLQMRQLRTLWDESLQAS